MEKTNIVNNTDITTQKESLKIKGVIRTLTPDCYSKDDTII